MKKIIAVVLSLFLLFTAQAAPAQACNAPAYKATTAVKINTDNGKPARWSQTLSPSLVRSALKLSGVVSRINQPYRETRMHSESSLGQALSMSRDIEVCSAAYGIRSARGMKCIDQVHIAYANYPATPKHFYVTRGHKLVKITR